MLLVWGPNFENHSPGTCFVEWSEAPLLRPTPQHLEPVVLVKMQITRPQPIDFIWWGGRDAEMVRSPHFHTEVCEPQFLGGIQEVVLFYLSTALIFVSMI